MFSGFRTGAATLILAAGCSVAASSTATAVPIVQDDFTFIYTSGPRTGTSGAGFVTFDAGAVPAVGSATLDAASGLVFVTITDFGGQTETSGPFFNGQPVANFDNGSLLGIFVTYVPTGATDNRDNWTIYNGSLVARETALGPYSRGTVTYQPVSANVREPASIGLLIAGLTGLGMVLRTRRV